jgi:hypothetical protein
MGDKLSAQAIERLYAEAVEMAKSRVGFHPLLSILDPAEPIKDWVASHPEKAAALAEDYHRLLLRYFNGSAPG